MARRNEYVEHLLELLRPFGPVVARAMFGGHGLYRDGVFFAIVAYDTLYLKVDEQTAPDFEALGLGPFVYESKLGERIVMSYREAPPAALEDPAVMAEWARKAYGVALRTRRAPAPKRPRAAAPRS